VTPAPASPQDPGADALLTALDDEQRVAARALRGPVCILAGAGTGKTRAITHRIAYGVATGVYSPNRVMALTFTARAAVELRSRLRPLGAGGVAARTFHAAALSQLNYFWPQVVGGDLPRILEGKSRLLGQAAETLRLRVDTAILRDLAAEIEWRKVSSLSLDDYERVARSSRALPGSLSLEQVLTMQQQYEDLKDERHQLDFEDVLLATAGMIEQEPAVAMQVREQYRFFVVDEYQDVSPLQHHLLSLWLGDRQDLCVVGDASQTIYSFAGAKSDYLLSFASEHDDATIVRLEQNYRSTPAVIDFANRLMRGRPGALSLHAVGEDREQGTPPTVTGYPSDVAEARGVAARIAELIDAGTRPESIAILYRVNVQAAALETALADAGVSYQIRGAKRFFDLPEVKQAVMSLRAASVSISGEPLFKSVSDVLRSLGWRQDAPETRGAVRDKWESLNALMGLAEQQPEGMTFRQFTDELMERQSSGHEPTVQAVNLATLHSAKGLEWPTVFLVGLSEGLVPISYASNFEQIDEERRLFYVGITRARERLLLSYSETGQGRNQARSPSRFLAEAAAGTRSPDAVPPAAR
jgi:DNA helicase-2/ATP-dependent DNA helicase PcrA